jgi:WD40 repeat protein/Flp pilus assembly protein TadD
VKVWDAELGQEALTFRGHATVVKCVAFSPDGRRLVSADNLGNVRVWDASSTEHLLSLVGHDGGVNYVTYSPDGRWIATAGGTQRDATVRLWDARSGHLVKTLHGHHLPVYSVAFSPDGKRLASVGGDHRLIFWDPETGQAAHTVEDLSHPRAVCFSPDGTRLATLGAKLEFWDAASGKRLRTIKNAATNDANLLAFSPDSRLLACGGRKTGRSGEVKVYDAASGEEVQSLKSHSDSVGGVGFSPDGSRILSASTDGTVKLWDAATGQELLTLRAHARGIHSAVFSPDGGRIATAGDDGTIKVWDASVGQVSPVFKADAGLVRDLSYSPDGNRVAFSVLRSGKTGTLKVWDIPAAREVLSVTGPTKNVASTCFTADGKRIIGGCWDGTVWVWDAHSGEALLTIQAHSWAINYVWVTRDGKQIASSPWSGDDVVKVWDSSGGKELLALRGHTSTVIALDFSADGSRIVTGSIDNMVKVWDTADGKELLNLDGHAEGVIHVAFTADGKRVVSRDAGGVEITWDLATGQPVPGPAAYGPYRGTRSPDGRYLAELDGATLRVHRLPDGSSVKREDDLAGLPPDYLWHERQATEAFENADWAGVLFHHERLLRDRAWDANFHVRHAYALRRLGRNVESATSYAQALLVDPDVQLWPADGRALPRAWAAAENGDWARAATEYELGAQRMMSHRRGVAPPPDNRQVARTREWADLLVTRVAAGMTAEAREAVPVLLAFAEIDQKNARFLALTCLRTPCEERDGGQLVELARRLVAEKRDAVSILILGAALYRAGRLEEAERALEESDALVGDGGYTESWLFQAMIRQRLGHPATAREFLRRFEKEHRFPSTADWRQRVRMKVLHDEAKRVVLTMPGASDEK